jgi:hypothetical protein
MFQHRFCNNVFPIYKSNLCCQLAIQLFTSQFGWIRDKWGTASKLLLFVPKYEPFMFFNLISKFPGQDIVAIFKAYPPWCKIEATPLLFAIFLFTFFPSIHSNVAPAASDIIVLGKIGGSSTNPRIGNPCLPSAMHFL